MRFLLGLVFGALLTVGAAYVHDTSIRSADAPTIVNWSQLDTTLRLVPDDMASGWERLSRAARS